MHHDTYPIVSSLPKTQPLKQMWNAWQQTVNFTHSSGKGGVGVNVFGVCVCACLHACVRACVCMHVHARVCIYAQAWRLSTGQSVTASEAASQWVIGNNHRVHWLASCAFLSLSSLNSSSLYIFTAPHCTCAANTPYWDRKKAGRCTGWSPGLDQWAYTADHYTKRPVAWHALLVSPFSLKGREKPWGQIPELQNNRDSPQSKYGWSA